MEDKLEVNIAIREEEMDDKIVFIVNNEETGVADFGDTLENAVDNFKKSLHLFLETYPEKRNLFSKKEARAPIMVSRIFL